MYLCNVKNNRGALILRAENTPFEPDPDNAGAREKEYNDCHPVFYPLLIFNCKMLLALI